MNQNQQRRAHTMQRYYNAKDRCEVPISADTGAKLKYEIQGIRLRPERLTKWNQCRLDGESAKQAEDKKKKESDIQDWTLYKTQLGEAQQKLYPLSKEQKKPVEPACVSILGDGGRKRKSSN